MNHLIAQYSSSEDDAESPVRTGPAHSSLSGSVHSHEPAASEPETQDAVDDFEEQLRLLQQEIHDAGANPDSAQDTPAVDPSFASSATSNFNSVGEQDDASDSNLHAGSAAKPQSPEPQFTRHSSLEDLMNDPALETKTSKIKNLLLHHGLIRQELDVSPLDATRPQSEPGQELIEKIILWTNLREKNLYFNTRLLNTHAFRNPLIMNKMMDFMELDGHGTLLSKVMYDPKELASWPDYAFLGTTSRTALTTVNRKPPTASGSSQERKIDFQKASVSSQAPKKQGKREREFSFGPRKRI
ncbi:hypothetical protein HDV03_004365 [Kappamyces sp. JEL0829]|nr:hypothetical protein HDV03_004365 [Kappamyces sp. JEL0829]KAJ3352798.1 hypothetical protein HDU91_005969 [Kappamyces sp. JEL0680]